MFGTATEKCRTDSFQFNPNENIACPSPEALPTRFVATAVGMTAVEGAAGREGAFGVAGEFVEPEALWLCAGTIKIRAAMADRPYLWSLMEDFYGNKEASGFREEPVEVVLIGMQMKLKLD